MRLHKALISTGRTIIFSVSMTGTNRPASMVIEAILEKTICIAKMIASLLSASTTKYDINPAFLCVLEMKQINREFVFICKMSETLASASPLRPITRPTAQLGIGMARLTNVFRMSVTFCTASISTSFVVARTVSSSC